MTIIMLKERAKYLVDSLGDNCEVIEYHDDKFIKIKIINMNENAIYEAFHAGSKYGIDFSFNNLKKIK